MNRTSWKIGEVGVPKNETEIKQKTDTLRENTLWIRKENYFPFGLEKKCCTCRADEPIQDNLDLSPELIMQIGHPKEFLSWHFER